MVERFITPALAIAAFAVTVGATAWQGGWFAAADSQPTAIAAPLTTPARAGLPFIPPAPSLAAVAAPTLVPITDAALQTDGAEVMAAAIVLPDSDALPSYEEDQEARRIEALHSARVR